MNEKRIQITLEAPKQQLVRVMDNPLGSSFIGNKNAPIQIIEFSDIQCPYCARAHTNLKALMAAYPEKINVSFRHFPLNFHKHAKEAAMAVVCAKRKNQDWALLDLLFDNQKSISKKTIRSMANQVGISSVEYDACITDDTVKTTVQYDMAEANRLNINSTPTLIVNGKLFKGLLKKEDIENLLN